MPLMSFKGRNWLLVATYRAMRRSQVWINQNIPDSELEIFEAAEGGGH